MPDKKLVMLAGPGRTTNIVYNCLARHFPIERLIMEDPAPRLEFLRKRARRMGWSRVLGQVFFRALVAPCLQLSSGARIAEISRAHDLDDTPPPADRVAHVTSVNSAECIALLRAMDPAVVVINGTRIIAREALESVPAKFINLHAGITPMYRGVHGGYWALVENDRAHCGVTVHLVDAGIDTGSVLGQATCTPGDKDNFVTHVYLQLAAGLPLLQQAVADALAGHLESKPYPPGPSRLWSHPTLLEYLRYRFHSGVK
jgi:folate-dependent phosphoribosylglycinamide formyltransferase PurN